MTIRLLAKKYQTEKIQGRKSNKLFYLRINLNIFKICYFFLENTFINHMISRCPHLKLIYEIVIQD